MKYFKIFLLSFFTLALCAGVFLNTSGDEAFADVVEPWNVIAEVTHNGKTETYNLKEAAETVAEKDSRGIFFSAKIKRQIYRRLVADGLPNEAVFEYILPLFTNLTKKFDYVNVEKTDAIVTFDKKGFHFYEGRDGVAVDTKKLFEMLSESCGKKISVQLPLIYDRALTISDLRKNTVKKASFTTRFASSGENRCHNIRLAAESLNGTTVEPGGTFSFNAVVGKRTEQNGYKTAKVISEGVYRDGVGGGVCQVSTTLYNALLLSEILPKACQHSLVSSYVLAGFDAMVSDGGADLSFVNNGESALYIAADVDLNNKSVTFTIYGAPNNFEIKRENEEERIPFETREIVDRQNYPELVYADQTKIVTAGSDGVKTKSYLCYYRNGNLVSRKLIRQNSYKKVDRVIARGYLQRD